MSPGAQAGPSSELRGSAGLYRRVFHEVREAILVFDARSFRIVDANPAAERLTRYSRAELKRLTIPDLSSTPDDAREILGHYVRGTLKRLPSRALARSDGSTCPVEVTIGDFSCGRRRMLVSVMRDLTEHRRAQEWAKLRLKERLLRECLMSVSHEIRTPIAAVKTHAELLSHASRRGHPCRRFARVIVRQTDRLAGLVDRMLDLSAVEARARRRKPKPASLADAVRGTMGSLKAAAGSRGVSMQSKVPEGIEVAFDAVDLSRVLQNLLENAVKHHRAGGRVWVCAHRVGAEVLACVCDNGVGIPYKEQPRVFDRLQRGARARRLGIPGAGLGLTLVRELVEGGGGRVWMESAPGKGTTFWLALPLFAGGSALRSGPLQFCDHRGTAPSCPIRTA